MVAALRGLTSTSEEKELTRTEKMLNYAIVGGIDGFEASR
jgi:hypothetical protein